MDCSPPFTVVITLSMMVFFVCFILGSFVLVGEGEVVLRVPLMNRHHFVLWSLNFSSFLRIAAPFYPCDNLCCINSFFTLLAY